MSTIRIGTILVLSLFAFTNINCGTAKKTVDPNLPRMHQFRVRATLDVRYSRRLGDVGKDGSGRRICRR